MKDAEILKLKMNLITILYHQINHKSRQVPGKITKFRITFINEKYPRILLISKLVNSKHQILQQLKQPWA